MESTGQLATLDNDSQLDKKRVPHPPHPTLTAATGEQLEALAARRTAMAELELEALAPL